MHSVAFKAMFHETIRNDDVSRNTALQHCCDVVQNDYNIVPTLEGFVVLKIVVANRSVYHHLQLSEQHLCTRITLFWYISLPWLHDYDVKLRGLKVMLHEVTDSQRRFLAQCNVATFLGYCFDWLQYCFNIATPCCTKNRRCELSQRRSATTILSATQRRSVGTMLQPFETMQQQCCNAVLR